MRSICSVAAAAVLFAAVFFCGVQAIAGDNAKEQKSVEASQGQDNQYSWLLEYNAVQNALDLNENQKKQIAQIKQKIDDAVPNPDSIRELPTHQREAVLHEWETKAQKLKNKLGDILSKEQMQRLEEIALQLRLKMRAAAQLAGESLTEKLSLSEQQTKKLEKLHDNIQNRISDARRTLAETGAKAGKISEEKAQQFRDDCRKWRDEAYEKAMDILSPEQKEKLSQMTGKMVNFNIEDLLSEQSARVERWTKRWRGESEEEAQKQPAPAAKTSEQHPVGTPAEDRKDVQ